MNTNNNHNNKQPQPHRKGSGRALRRRIAPGRTCFAYCMLHLAISSIILSLTSTTQAQSASPSLLADTPQLARVEASVDRAVRYLAEHQNPDGSWPNGVGNGRTNQGVNGICLLAMMGRGHAPNRGPYRDAINRALTHIISSQNEQGLFVSDGRSHGPMYEHALATLAVIEAYGFLPSDPIRRSAQKAVDLIVGAQNNEGGWRYQPEPNDADLSVTVMQVVALRAAQNARLHVPQETLDGALQYTRECAVPSGGFAYMPGRGPKVAMSAAGALCLQLLGQHDDPAINPALAFVRDREFNHWMDGYFYYASYYAMQAHFQAGGQQWADWHPRVRQYLLNTQNEDGSWPGWDEDKFNTNETKAYSTAFAAMSLEVYMHYLPAYQR